MKDIFEIDQNRLDDEWNEQLNLYRKWAERLANAKRTRLEAKAKLEEAEAEAMLDVRKRPEKYGLEDPKEASYKAAVLLHPKYKEAIHELIGAQYEEDMVGAALETVSQRKYAIQDYVKLFLADYFSAPRVDDEGGRETTSHFKKRHLRSKQRTGHKEAKEREKKQ